MYLSTNIQRILHITLLTSSTPCHFCWGVTSIPEATGLTQRIVREQSKLMGVDLSVSPELFPMVHCCSITLPWSQGSRTSSSQKRQKGKVLVKLGNLETRQLLNRTGRRSSLEHTLVGVEGCPCWFTPWNQFYSKVSFNTCWISSCHVKYDILILLSVPQQIHTESRESGSPSLPTAKNLHGY